MATYISIETDKKISYQIDGGDKQTMFANIEYEGYPEPTGTITITENGTGIDVKDYAEADVNVPGGGYPEPTGTITITENGTGIDVKDYAEADVNVPTYPEPTGIKQISITQNGTTTENVKDYASAEITVNVPGNTQNEDAIITGTLTTYTNDRVTTIKTYAFADMANLTSISLPNVVSLTGERQFANSGVQTINMPKLTSGSVMMFGNCQSLTDIPQSAFPALATIYTYMFNNCQHLESADFLAASRIDGSAFGGCLVFDTLILRNENVVTLSNVNAFDNTPFRGKNGLTGTVYVPSDLISSYQAASGWAALYTDGYCTFSAIEGSQYE